MALAGAALIAGAVIRRHRLRKGMRAVAVLGSRAATQALAAQLAAREMTGYETVGHISAAKETTGDAGPLGSLPDLRELVARHRIELLLLTSGVPRIAVFDQLATSCYDLPVRLCELSEFYEDRFGHIPISEINSAWFQCILHPKYRVAPAPTSDSSTSRLRSP